jgi:hypothetical protein
MYLSPLNCNSWACRKRIRKREMKREMIFFTIDKLGLTLQDNRKLIKLISSELKKLEKSFTHVKLKNLPE